MNQIQGPPHSRFTPLLWCQRSFFFSPTSSSLSFFTFLLSSRRPDLLRRTRSFVAVLAGSHFSSVSNSTSQPISPGPSKYSPTFIASTSSQQTSSISLYLSILSMPYSFSVFCRSTFFELPFKNIKNKNAIFINYGLEF